MASSQEYQDLSNEFFKLLNPPDPDQIFDDELQAYIKIPYSNKYSGNFYKAPSGQFIPSGYLSTVVPSGFTLTSQSVDKTTGKVSVTYNHPKMDGATEGIAFPSNVLGYSISENTYEWSTVPDFGATFLPLQWAITSVPIGVGQTYTTFESTYGVIAFEGTDIVDASTADMSYDNGVLTVPNNVYAAVYGGMIPFKERLKLINAELVKNKLQPYSEQEYMALQYWKPSLDNAVTGTEPLYPEHVPYDSVLKQFKMTQFVSKTQITSKTLESFGVTERVASYRSGSYKAGNKIIDVFSNKIKADYKPDYVTYISCTKPIFRDIVSLKTSAYLDASYIYFNSKWNIQTINFLGPHNNIDVSVLRYVPVVNSAGKMQWKLSESWGIKPKQVISNTNSLRPLYGSKINEDILQQHYCYDLNSLDPEPKNPQYPPMPHGDKIGYEPAFAREKADPSSQYYDKNFKYSEFYSGKSSANNAYNGIPSIVTPSNVQTISLEALHPDNTTTYRIYCNRNYQSQRIEGDFNQSTRIGMEFGVRHPHNTEIYLPPIAAIYAVKTKATTIGITASYTEAESKAYVYCPVIVGDGGGVITVRTFEDYMWAPKGDKGIPESSLNKFLMGEIPYVSDGPPAIMPRLKTQTAFDEKTDVVVAYGIQTINQKAYKINEDFEFQSSGTFQTLYIPPTLYGKSFSFPNGVTERTTKYVPTAFLSASVPFPPMADKETALTVAAKIQLSELQAETFPLTAESYSAGAIDKNGSQMIAYEKSGRIDLAYRHNSNMPWIVIRDVIFRPNDSGSRPSATNPYILTNLAAEQWTLFYVYQNRLMVKPIPFSIFKDEDFINIPLPTMNEQLIALDIQKIQSIVVYDGYRPDVTTDLTVEINVYKSVKKPTDESKSIANTSVQKAADIKDFSIVYNEGKYFAFIQDGTRIRCRKSADIGDWRDVFDSTMTFIPKNTAQATSGQNLEDVMEDGYISSAIYDESTRTVLVFFIYDGCILIKYLPSDIFILDKAAATEKANVNIPFIVYGKITANLKGRKIPEQISIPSVKEDIYTISNHRTAIIRNFIGYYRLFFLTDNGLRSSISMQGKRWFTEKQWIYVTDCVTEA